MMKIYISADMEGLPGIQQWSDVEKGSRRYPIFREELIREVALVSRVILEHKGSVTLRDAHWTGRNIPASKVPRGVRLISGWSGHPYAMMEHLDTSYDGAIFIGYHGGAGSDENALGHFYSRNATKVLLNGTDLSELRITTYIAAQERVPVLCVLGDAAVCREAEKLIKNVAAVETLTQSSISMGNTVLAAKIEEAVRESLRRRVVMPKLPQSYLLRVRYRHQKNCRKALEYKNVRRKTKNAVTLKVSGLNGLLNALEMII